MPAIQVMPVGFQYHQTESSVPSTHTVTTALVPGRLAVDMLK
jgi:hypothetical protein